MTEPYNYGNNEYSNNYQSQDDELSNLMSSDEEYGQHDNPQDNYDENQNVENSADSSSSSSQEQSYNNDVEDNDSTQIPTISYDDLKDKLVNPPSNATQEPKFGEKDMYRVINLVTLLSQCDDDVIKWVEDILRIGGNDNVRRSMNIIKMDRNDFEEQVDTIKVMKSILKISQDGAANGDAFKTVIDLMNTVDNMTDNQRDGLLKLNRKLIRSSGAKIRITSKKTSNSSEIAQDLHKVLTEDDVIPQYVESLDSIIDAIRQIIK